MVIRVPSRSPLACSPMAFLPGHDDRVEAIGLRSAVMTPGQAGHHGRGLISAPSPPPGADRGARRRLERGRFSVTSGASSTDGGRRRCRRRALASCPGPPCSTWRHALVTLTEVVTSSRRRQGSHVNFSGRWTMQVAEADALTCAPRSHRSMPPGRRRSSRRARLSGIGLPSRSHAGGVPRLVLVPRARFATQPPSPSQIQVATASSARHESASHLRSQFRATAAAPGSIVLLSAWRRAPAGRPSPRQYSMRGRPA